MLVFPNAKINLGLNITEKRSDGFHNLESVFLPIDFSDILEVIPNKNGFNNFFESGLKLDCKLVDNILVKTIDLLQSLYEIPFVDIYLHKILPFGAGLGGGSSDASFLIKAVNNCFGLKLSNREMEDISLKIGSDCPFFIDNRPKIVKGRGDLLSDYEYNGPSEGVIIVPEVSVGTKEAYAGIMPSYWEYSLENVLRTDPMDWHNLLKNDFENSIFKKYPELSSIKTELYKQGAVYASMSGSGSSIYGLFYDKPNIDSNKFKSIRLIKEFRVLN